MKKILLLICLSLITTTQARDEEVIWAHCVDEKGEITFNQTRSRVLRKKSYKGTIETADHSFSFTAMKRHLNPSIREEVREYYFEEGYDRSSFGFNLVENTAYFVLDVAFDTKVFVSISNCEIETN